MTFEEWVEKYKPLKNEYGEVALFETYGSDIDFLNKQNPDCIWTLEDTGDGAFIASGVHFVNRIGYYVTEIPVSKTEHIFVNIESETEE